MGSQPTQIQLPAWAKGTLQRMLKPGVLLGSLGAAVLLYLPSHSFGTAFGTGITTFVVIGGLRAADKPLTPLWNLIGKVPWQIRYVAGVALPILYSKSQFTASAGGQEISRTRTALLVSTVVTYVLMRPKRGAMPGQG